MLCRWFRLTNLDKMKPNSGLARVGWYGVGQSCRWQRTIEENPMNRIVLPLLMLAVSLAPVLCWAAEPSARQAKAVGESERSGGKVEEGKPEQSTSDVLFRELLAGLPKDGERAASARLELEYWHENGDGFFAPPLRKSVKTKDGKTAEVVLLTAPARGMPGTDFSMAFLLIEKQVVDWASCWTYNRTATQDLQLEDVDGDGFLDVAFRAKEGCWGLDERQHSRPGDKRKWLYAYAITGKGFQSLFPSTEHDLNVKVAYDAAGQPVTLQAKGLPQSLRERRMVECTLSATNTSKKDLVIQPGKWFDVEIEKKEKVGYFMTYSPPDKRALLKAGESVSQAVRLFVHGEEKEVTIRWRFVTDRR